MDSHHRAIRAILQRLPPPEAIRYIKSFDLPPDEEFCIIQREVRKKSRLEIAALLPSSVETVDDRRRSAYQKIAWTIRDCANVEEHIRAALREMADKM